MSFARTITFYTTKFSRCRRIWMCESKIFFKIRERWHKRVLWLKASRTGIRGILHTSSLVLNSMMASTWIKWVGNPTKHLKFAMLKFKLLMSPQVVQLHKIHQISLLDRLVSQTLTSARALPILGSKVRLRFNFMSLVPESSNLGQALKLLTAVRSVRVAAVKRIRCHPSDLWARTTFSSMIGKSRVWQRRSLFLKWDRRGRRVPK